MTQDQYGQAQGTGYVRGEVVPDDEAGTLEADQSGPMTRLRKVASAIRGERADETVPNQTGPMGDMGATASPAAATASPAAEEEIGDGEYPDAARQDDVGAVRSPEASDRDYWDDETARGGGMAEPVPDTRTDFPAAAQTRAEDATASYPSMTGGSAYGTPEPAATDGLGPAPGYGSQASILTDPHMPASGGPAGVGPAASGPTGTGEGTAAGKHAATAADAGLRPGEATDRIGDFGDIAFGNLLPDAAQYSAQWQQIQFRFVDDPQGSVTEAADVLSQVTAKLEAAIQERQRAIEERKQAIQERASALRGRWGEGSNADTETLRETLRMYRAFMDQLIGSTSKP